MFYLILKSLHIFAVVIWVGALFLVSYVTSKSSMNNEQLHLATRITDAAIGVTWLAGIVLVIMGSWYFSTWWQLKVVLVVFISAIHTFLHRRWKMASTEGYRVPVAVPYIILLLTIIIILLVVLKRPI